MRRAIVIDSSGYAGRAPAAAGRGSVAGGPLWRVVADAATLSFAKIVSSFTGEIRGLLQGQFVFAVGGGRSAPVTVAIAAVSR